MYLTRLGMLVLAVCFADAFKDTSPFFFFSTSEYAVHQLLDINKLR